MRLLFLPFAFPLPANTGYKMRTWSVLEALAAARHEITLLTFGDSKEVDLQKPQLRRVCQEVEVVPGELGQLSATANYLGRLAGLFSAMPFAVRRFVSPAMQNRIEWQLKVGRFDAMICDTVYTAVNIPPVRVPIVLNSHNVEHILLQRYISLERNPAKRIYAWIEMLKLRNWERETGRLSSLALACSENDHNLLTRLCPELRVNVVPNIVDAATYAPSAMETETSGKTVLFQGAMDWFPNRDAVSFFAERILPVLRKGLPGVRFVVAGRNPPLEFRQSFSNAPDIEFTGALPDMRAAIAAATVCVVPVRIGSGTRLKILEAAALAKPIVSTRVGAEGLDFVNGTEIMLADSPSEFARAVADLLADGERRKAMGVAARARVEEQYSVPALRSAIAQAMSHLPTRNRAVSATLTPSQDRSPVHP